MNTNFFLLHSKCLPAAFVNIRVHSWLKFRAPEKQKRGEVECLFGPAAFFAFERLDHLPFILLVRFPALEREDDGPEAEQSQRHPHPE
jgi:hypothetical protein